MDSSFNADRPDDDLSTAFGTETLAERDMIPEGFANTPTSRTDMPVEVIRGGRYLRVDQSANLRDVSGDTIGQLIRGLHNSAIRGYDRLWDMNV
jgi:hypothetical protein